MRIDTESESTRSNFGCEMFLDQDIFFSITKESKEFGYQEISTSVSKKNKKE